MTGNRQRKRMGPSALCLKYRRLTVLPFSSIPLNFPRETPWAKVWLNEKCRTNPYVHFSEDIDKQDDHRLPETSQTPCTRSLSPNAARRPGSGACVCRHARVHACVRACAARRNHEGARLSSVCVHSFRKISSRPQEDALRSFALRADREAQFNSCEGC